MGESLKQKRHLFDKRAVLTILALVGVVSSASGAHAYPFYCKCWKAHRLDPGECIQWMLSAWTCLPEEAEPICKYYVETHLKPKACKGKPLAHWFVTEVVSAQLLKTKDGRKKFLQAWGANRATRFSKGPKALWSKKG